MSLRDDLLNRIAVELHDQEGDIIEENYAVAAEFILDHAFLDTLADRADEWWVEAAGGRAVDCRTEHWVVEPEGLVAVLREGDEQ